MDAVECRVLARLVALVTNPSNVALAGTGVHATSVVTAVVQTDGHIAVVTLPSREARTDIGNKALAISARVEALDLVASATHVALGAGALARKLTQAMAIAIFGANRLLTLGALPSVLALDNHRGTVVVRVDLDTSHQAVSVTHARLDIEIDTTIGTLVSPIAGALTRTNAHTIG